MHSDRSPDTPDREQQVDEFRLGGKEFAEFINHYEQVGKRRKFRSLDTQLAVVAD